MSVRQCRETMARIMSNIDSQKFVYQYLNTYDKIYELLYRADNSKFALDITNDIIHNNQFPGYENIEIKTQVNKSTEMNDDIYILIELYFNTTPEPTRFGHVTLHLVKNNELMKNIFSKTPIHIVNDRDKRKLWKLYVSPRIGNNVKEGLVFSIGSCFRPGHHPNDPIPNISNSIINILNAYFDPTHALSITNKTNSSTIDPELELYANQILQYSHPKPSSYSGILTHKKRKSMKRKNRVTLKNGAPR